MAQKRRRRRRGNETEHFGGGRTRTEKVPGLATMGAKETLEIKKRLTKAKKKKTICKKQQQEKSNSMTLRLSRP